MSVKCRTGKQREEKGDNAGNMANVVIPCQNHSEIHAGEPLPHINDSVRVALSMRAPPAQGPHK